MRIFLDIGHPAHVHYFKHFIKQMERNGHSFLITARDKDVSLELLNCYNINYKNRGRGGVGLVGKFFYMIRADLFLLIHAIHFKPDIFVSFSSPYAAQVSWLIRKPHIAFTDTEHATLGNLVCTPFSKVVCTPSCYTLDFGKKHFRFEGYMELSYLHPNYFTPAPIILDTLGIKAGEKYVIFRFVSWQASHDMGQSGLS